jgi:hypothetical protein
LDFDPLGYRVPTAIEGPLVLAADAHMIRTVALLAAGFLLAVWLLMRWLS